ncbi:hypothetical protein Tbis_3564 [Thermobispora bispora DSM 43833]|uniref:DUF2029 domain-containing protein n=2 Tax=Thermobispora bispora TaxID=2006 RepID=D6YAJ9_THEBD|nr:hypothetical protein Tbis_3564 [Thermobispora bispora DSM 43833]QSI46681.1 DUF2029 domain-containing protein [Thermobispora bispora]
MIKTMAATVRRRLPWLGVVWVLTRAALFLAALQVIPVGHEGAFENDVTLYQGWSQVLLGGEFPAGDEKWQYPPLAALPLVAPHLVPFVDYRTGFYLIAVLCDLGIVLLIRRFEGGPRTGTWAWTIGAALLGPLLISRYDLMVTLVAVAALTVSARPAVRGALIGVGLAIKVWPVALLAGLRDRWELLRTAGPAVAVTAAVCGAAALLMPNAFDWLTAQQERGLQVESLAATPFALARALGWWPGYTTYQYGAMELVGPGIETATTVSVASTCLALTFIATWWVGARPTAVTYYDAAFTVVLLLVLTSRVLSPQYLVWLLGLAAVVLAVPRGESSQRPAAWLVLLAGLLTGIMYPWLEQDYSWTGTLPGTLVLTARNLVLLAAAVVSCARLWRSTSPSAAAEGERVEIGT